VHASCDCFIVICSRLNDILVLVRDTNIGTLKPIFTLCELRYCRLLPPSFLAECHKIRLTQGYLVLCCIFSCLCYILCQYESDE